ncbi:MAG: serine hydrolase [Eubacterium sp.]|nr:serine hydrolase [Eubacterium sp.]
MNQDNIRKMESVISSDYDNMTGMVIFKDGEAVYEKYYNSFTEANRIHIFSATKSIISILFGIAIDKGMIEGLDQKVLDFFPDYQVKRGEKTLQNIRIRDMLTMTVPYKFKFNPYVKYFTSPDWVKFSLDKLGGKGKIGEFRYAPIVGPDVLSGILVKATGKSVLDFARENLFDPLGINVENTVTFKDKEEQMEFYKADDVSGWVAGPTGVHTAGWGLTLAPMDMAKIGQMYLDGGVWEGRRIVSESWIKESTSEHSRWNRINIGYGYLWWIAEDENGFAAMGDGGNIIYVSRDKRMVVAVTSTFKPRAKDRIEFIKKYVEPLFV